MILLKGAIRNLLAQKRFTLVAIATIGLGVGACTAIFAVVYGVLLTPLPYPDPGRIVRLWQVGEGGGRMDFSDPNFEDVRDQSRSFSAIAQYSSSVVSVAGGSVPVRVPGAIVSEGFFDAIGVAPVLGRPFAEEERSEGAPPVVIVSYGYWQRYLGAEEDLGSLALGFNHRNHSVVGVMPPGFTYPDGAELWTPREQYPRYESRTAHNWDVIARRQENVSLDLARSDVREIARQLRTIHGDDTWMVDAVVVPLHEALVGHVQRALVVLLGAVGFLLLVACANVANLLLARLSARSREIALRRALGASRSRLGVEFLLEMLVLSILGGGVGLLGSVFGVRALLALDPARLPRHEEIGISLATVGMALVVSVGAAIALGLFAAFRAAGDKLSERLTEGGRSGMSGSSGLRARNGIVVAQLGMTVMLLLGALLLGRSLLRLLEVAPGFQTQRRVVMQLSVSPPRDDLELQTLSTRIGSILDGVRSLPGVQRAGVVDRLPMDGGPRRGIFLRMNAGEEVEDFETFGRLMKDEARAGSAGYRAATEGYFRTLGIPLVRGRVFDASDTSQSNHVAVVSESLAEEFPNGDPLGQLIEFGNMDGDLRLMTIVGIVGDIRQQGLDTPLSPTIYVNARQRPPATFNVVMQTAASPESVITSARDAASRVYPDVPPQFRMLEEIVSESYADRTFNLTIVGVFALAALLLASIGIYGVTSYSVHQRRREFGLRMALGARRADVLRMVLGQGGRLVGVGVALGLVGAVLLSRVLSSLLYGISARDPLTFAIAAVPIAVIAILACYAPARSATHVDPMVALREE